MRTLSEKTRLTNNIGAIISTNLYTQARAHALRTDTKLSVVIRQALEHYLDNADTITKPANFGALLTAPDTLSRFKRDRTVNIVINPVKFPQLRDRLDIFAKAHRLQASTVLRRAIYEYTKPTDPNTQPDPVATIDAWIDRPMEG